MATRTLTDLHVGAGRPLRWPTYLAISADVLVTRPGDITKDGMNALIMLRDERLFDAEVSTFYGDNLHSGVYSFSHAMLGTNPRHVFLPGEGNYRLIPEDVDGCEPLLCALPWRGPVLNGIGVVKGIDRVAAIVTISGRSYHGDCMGWIPFTVRGSLRSREDNPFPISLIPPRGTLVTFDALMDGLDVDGVVHGTLYRLHYLRHAHSRHLEELDMADVAAEWAQAQRMVHSGNATDGSGSQDVMAAPNTSWSPNASDTQVTGTVGVQSSYTNTRRMAEDLTRFHTQVFAVLRAAARTIKNEQDVEAAVKEALSTMQERVNQELIEAEARMLVEVANIESRVVQEVARTRSQLQAHLRLSTQDLLRTVSGTRHGLCTDLQESAMSLQTVGTALHRNLTAMQDEQVARLERIIYTATFSGPTGSTAIAASPLVQTPARPPPPQYDATPYAAAGSIAQGRMEDGEIEDDASSEEGDVDVGDNEAV
ncbi:hypothetical protein OC834_006548 [Tilletia horrida]|uniref:Uncharacterized protein n=1 Tax=Tilletia horrida TaxID=155126 RepID=A0AAN6G5R4_9BASI|nr:hypothetical protein OC834_006548 [Tilletia horrida]KAK0522353.1 hypothetical protein OC842_006489 [Tilletia horrida]KAK0552664.1 hypothetical protein OC844_006403 [Tilletia horrida]